MFLAARAVLVDASTWIEDGSLWIERGRVRRVLTSRRALLRQSNPRSRHQLEDCVLTPGLVNAHAHLDLGPLARAPRAGSGFVPWIRAVVDARTRATSSTVRATVRAALRALVESGTTAVGDIDATGTSARIGSLLGVRLRVYREVLDAWDPRRTARALELARAPVQRSNRVSGGLSPHAPYTTSEALLRGLVRHAHATRRRLAIHWSETPEERQWLEHGRGPMARLFREYPGLSGLQLLDRAGVLSSRTTLVHGNLARPAELTLLASRGISLVHCPGTHAFFSRPRFALQRYRERGIPLALGTDSLASNASLDMRREMSLLRESHPDLAPGFVFEMATEGGGRALGWPRVGHLRPGSEADVVAWRMRAATRTDALEQLTAGRPPVGHVFVGGRRV